HNAFIEQATGTRVIFWNTAKKGIAEKPLLGWGPEQFQTVFVKNLPSDMYLNENNREKWVDRPHYAVVEFFVSGGIIGGVLYVACIAIAFVVPIILSRRRIVSRWELAFLIGCASAYTLP